MLPLIAVGVAAFVALGGLVVERLWNWLTPPLFGWHVLGYWQALGLLALCRILFGGLGVGGGGGPRSMFRRRMRERWEQMSPEDRERFRHGMRGPWGPGPEAGEGTQA